MDRSPFIKFLIGFVLLIFLSYPLLQSSYFRSPTLSCPACPALPSPPPPLQCEGCPKPQSPDILIPSHLAQHPAVLFYTSLQREGVIEIFKRFAQRHKEVTQPGFKPKEQQCIPVEAGRGWGAHQICGNQIPSKGCTFFSFGISRDYSFDEFLVKSKSCQGFGFDPTVHYQRDLFPGFQFFEVGATAIDGELSSTMTVASVPFLAGFFALKDLSLLKMDCEGCEFALARDILQVDPDFLKRVGQFVVEIHVSRILMKSFLHAKNYAMLLKLLEDAGLVLVHSDLASCGEGHESHGCHPELHEAGYPCEKGRMCQNFLFSRETL